MKQFLTKLYKDESGQSLTEYALILAVVAAVVAGVMLTMGDKVKAVFQKIIDKFTEAES